MSRIPLQEIFTLLMLLFMSSISSGVEIISDPIIEGKSIAGLSISDTEDKIFEVLHKRSLELIDVIYPETNEKLMAFANMTEEGGLAIDVILKEGAITNIVVISPAIKGKYYYKGKTIKGYSFGDSFQVIEKLYGKPHMKRNKTYWYKNEGIIFQAVGEGVVEPNVIIIMAPGSEITSTLKYRAGLTEIGR